MKRKPRNALLEEYAQAVAKNLTDETAAVVRRTLQQWKEAKWNGTMKWFIIRTLERILEIYAER